MNDRFKFRVWDKIHKRYIYCDFAGYCSVDYSGNGEKRIVFMTSGVEQIKNGRPLLYAKEDEAEIEQCTGLRDKNGKLIYENDYVKYKGNIYKVFWNKMKISLENILNNDIIDVQEFDCMEVIGNEHEKGNIRKI